MLDERLDNHFELKKSCTASSFWASHQSQKWLLFVGSA